MGNKILNIVEKIVGYCNYNINDKEGIYTITLIFDNIVLPEMYYKNLIKHSVKNIEINDNSLIFTNLTEYTVSDSNGRISYTFDGIYLFQLYFDEERFIIYAK